MINIKFKSFGVLLCIAFFNNAQSALKDKSILGSVLDTFSGSGAVYLIEKYILGPINNITYKMTDLGQASASEEYQLLGKEAQDALKIPEEKQIPIRKIAPTSLMSEVIPVAFSMTDAMYFNEKKLKDALLGVKRAGAFVEAVHKKYNHGVAQFILGLGSIILSPILTYKVLGQLQLNKKMKIPGALASIICASIIAKGYQNYCFRRSDIEGHYATECHLCVQESAEYRQNSPKQELVPFTNNPLGKIELDKIIEDLKSQNKSCKHHQRNY